MQVLLDVFLANRLSQNPNNKVLLIRSWVEKTLILGFIFPLDITKQCTIQKPIGATILNQIKQWKIDLYLTLEEKLLVGSSSINGLALYKRSRTGL